MDDTTAVNVHLNRKKTSPQSIVSLFGSEVRDLIYGPLPVTQEESRSKQLYSNLRFITEFT
jgi:hypothetical protein